MINSYTPQSSTSTLHIPTLPNSLRIPFARISKGEEESQTLICKDKGKTMVIPYDEILYVKASHVYVEIICKNGKKILKRDSLSRMLKQLHSTHFIQTHRSFAINKNQVSRWDHSNIYIQDAVIPMSRSRRKTIKEFLSY